MAFLPTVGGMGAATIAGTFFNKLTPAAILWQPQGTRAQVEPTPETETNSESAGTFPKGVKGAAPIIDGVNSGVNNPNFAAVQKLIFHCASSENYSVSNSITKFPVDSGFAVSDHGMRQNPVIQVEGVVSNMPIGPMDLTSLEGILQIGGAITGSPLGGVLAGAIGLGKTLSGTQVANADHFHNKLEELVNTCQIVSISTVRGLYHNCVVTNYSTNANADTSAALHFSITLEKLNIVDTSGNSIIQTNQALDSLPALGQQRVKGYMNSIGIGAIGSVFS